MTFSLFLQSSRRANKSAGSVFIPYPDPFLDDNSPNHGNSSYIPSRGHPPQTDNDIHGFSFDQNSPLLSGCLNDRIFEDPSYGLSTRYAASKLFESNRHYEHAYFRPISMCDHLPGFRKDGLNKQYLVMSFCVSTDSATHYELCIPMGMAEQFSVDHVVDPDGEFQPYTPLYKR